VVGWPARRENAARRAMRAVRCATIEIVLWGNNAEHGYGERIVRISPFERPADEWIVTDFFRRLRERKMVQWALAYVAASFALIQILDIVSQRFGWPEQTIRLVIIGAALGFFVTPYSPCTTASAALSV